MTLKEKIKELSNQQKYYKNQRKTVNLVGERTIRPEVAAYYVWSGKSQITHHLIAYAEMRGKENPYPNYSYNKDKVDKIINDYKVVLI